MPTTITLDPVTRIEGHLEIEVTVDVVRGQQQVISARSMGKMFRGFEIILAGRDPRDAAMYTQRICGVCPVSHAMASSLNLDNAFGVTPPDNGRILRNLVLGANFIQSHLLHFYHLSVLDYVNTTGLLDKSPWTPRYVTADMATGANAATLVSHYVAALAMRRKAHQMGALFGGKLPCLGSFVVGGCTEAVTAEKIADFRSLLTGLRSFINNVYLADANTLGDLFPTYFTLGGGNENLLAFGVFDLDSSGANRFFSPGRYAGGAFESMDPAQIAEYVMHSWYTPASGNLNPAQGVTEPDAEKQGAYSWLKAPRYADLPYELGPLARMWINHDYTRGISAMDRIIARAQETKKIADAMDGWLDELTPDMSGYATSEIPVQATSAGLTEAPRGALGHWMNITDSTISRYQVITPTAWNASPRDDVDVPGPIEAALVGVPVADIEQPVEVLRIVHTFDPCLACAVHMVRPGERVPASRVLLQPGLG
ncbi:MAG: nickel-dependent hydrogenase large subunit [Phycisphaerae bacterium]|jgi:hydrogenase large subunit